MRRLSALALAVLLPAAAACSGPTAPAPTSVVKDGPGTTATSTPPAGQGTPPVTDGVDNTPTTGTPDDASTTTSPPETAQLPRGGTEIFPTFRLFGYSGAPLSPGLGRLGIGDLDDRVVEMEERGKKFEGGRELMPVLELIATVVHPVPGKDGMYRSHTEDKIVQDYLDAARRHDAILLLNIQPGRADFIDEIKYWEKWLEEPDVGVALDPEWAVDEGQTPGRVYGHTTGEELDDVASYLADMVEEHNLPEKVMVYHQVHPQVVRHIEDLRPHDGVAIINSVDGIGTPSMKKTTYDVITKERPSFVVPGFKLFYEEDAAMGPLMTAKQVLALKPRPQYILFE